MKLPLLLLQLLMKMKLMMQLQLMRFDAFFGFESVVDGERNFDLFLNAANDVAVKTANIFVGLDFHSFVNDDVHPNVGDDLQLLVSSLDDSCGSDAIWNKAARRRGIKRQRCDSVCGCQRRIDYEHRRFDVIVVVAVGR